MRRIKEFRNKERLIWEVENEIARGGEKHFIHRLHVVLLVLKGQTIKQAAEVFDASRFTVQRWVKTLRLEGVSGLEDAVRTGRPPRLTLEQVQSLRSDIEQGPTVFGYTQPFWDGPLLAEHILQQYQVTFGVRRCEQLFHQMGYSMQRPRPSPNGFLPEAREAFEQVREEEEEDPDVELWYQDEVHFQQATTVTQMWAPIGQQPNVLSAPTREKIGFIGAVNPQTGELYTNPEEVFNTESMERFLRDFLKDQPANGKKIVMVMDNAPWHKVAPLRFEKEFPDRFAVLFLPAYSPDLNPIERVWRWIRRKCTHNRYFKTIQDLLDLLTDFFEEHGVPNHRLRTLCAHS